MINHRRRRFHRVLNLSRLLSILPSSRVYARPKPRHGSRLRNRGYALNEMDSLSEQSFHRMFRMSRFSFYALLDLILPLINRFPSATVGSGGLISPKTRLAVTLRWLAGGSYQDICFAFGISVSSFYSDRGVLWPTIEAIDKVFDMGLPLEDVHQLNELALGFKNHSGGILDGCVLAMDGLFVRTRCPYSSETENRKDYVNRKGGFGIVILAGADVNAKFVFAISNHAGSTNDITIWQESDLRDAVDNGRLPERFFMIGDEAFSCTNQLLTPWPGRGLDTYKDSFNYWLSHSRQCIERAFGILTQRWGIFWRKFTFAYSRWSIVVQVCMKLHNFCINLNDKSPTVRFQEDQKEGDEWLVIPNEQDNDDILRRKATGDRRRRITSLLQERGIQRPIPYS